MIAPHLKKDWALLWPLVGLVTLIQLGLEWADYNIGLPNASPAAFELLRPLTVAWFLVITGLVVAVVQSDAIPGVDQDWLIRPVRRGDLLFAKLVLLALAISIPMFAVNLGHALLIGFSWGDVAGAIAEKELWTFVSVIVPLAALAAVTRTLSELLLLSAALVVIYAGSAVASGYLLGVFRCPTCATGFVWLQHLLQHLEIVVGACAILGLQYYRRRTATARALILLAPAALVFVQLPWGLAVAIQQGVSGLPGSSGAVTIAAGLATLDAVDGDTAPRLHVENQAARALLQGDLDSAVGLLAVRHDISVGVNVPLSVSGLADDQLLLVDRVEAHIVDAHRERYRYTLLDQPADELSPPAGGTGNVADPLHQLLRMPLASLQSVGPAAPTLQLDYWLTLLQVVEQHRMPALQGIWRSKFLGQCRSHVDEDNLGVSCRQIGQGPMCFSATLYGADGSHNAEMRRCLPEYRPYLPSVAFALSYAGQYLPIRDRSGAAHYSVDWTRLKDANVLVKIYGQREHFKRILTGISIAERGP